MELIKYKVCPECGKHNLPSLLECRFCEADLTGVKVIDASTESNPDTTPSGSAPDARQLVRFCECGEENPPQARKCKSCGEDISDIIPTYSEQKTTAAYAYELQSIDGAFSQRIDKPVIVVGRETEFSEYLQPKLYVSRQHARFSVVAGKVFVENLSQTNKTYLNNKEIADGTPIKLADGDEIGLGGKVIDGKRQDKAAYFIFQSKP